MGILLVGTLSLVGGWGGAYLGSYLKKKGENLATHEDIGKLVEQVRAVTQATKEIEASISDRSWNRQRHWEMKREAIVAVIQEILDTKDLLQSLAGALRSPKGHRNEVGRMVAERAQECSERMSTLDAKRVLALIVCGRNFDRALSATFESLRLAADGLADCNMKAYEDIAPRIRLDLAKVLFFAQKGLGLD